MDNDHHVNGQPGIKVNIESEGKKGHIWLCPIYDCFKHDADIEITPNEIVEFYCPHCKKTLTREIKCKLCDAPMVGLTISIGGKVNVCSRKGCKNHYVVFEDLNDAMSLFYDQFENNP
jgi:predicted RNA-binding Zn-ribbon protein involved in translation (DUF1610 family)